MFSEDEELSTSPFTPVIPILQEPDLVASTKSNNQGKIPVAPPRRKKKSKDSTIATPSMSLTVRSLFDFDYFCSRRTKCCTGSALISPLRKIFNINLANHLDVQQPD